MWWRNAQCLMVLVVLALTGCGFHPLYGSRSGTPASAQIRERLSSVQVSPIDERLGQILHNALLDRIPSEDASAQPLYRLQVTVQEAISGINFQKNATASGGEMSVSSSWQLFDRSTGRRLASGSFSSIDSVNYLGPRYASIVAERDAERRALDDLADMITDRVAVYLSTHKP